MSLSNTRRTLLLLIACGVAIPAQALLVTREFSGSWFDPAKVGQGFNLDIATSNGAKTAVLYWYTYDGNGRPLWLYGQSAVAAGNSVSVDLFEVSGPRFGQDFTATQLGLMPFGRIQLVFSSCAAATASYSGNLGGGTLNLARLTQGYGGSCTGTLIDDGKAASIDNATQTASGSAETVRSWAATVAAPAASGKLKYSTSAGRVRFSAEAEDVPAGSYVLLGDGVQRATVQVVAVPGGTQGEVEFSAPADGNELPLDFDPRGMRFVLRSGSTDWLAGNFDAVAGSGSAAVGGSSSAAPPTGNALTVIRFGTGAVQAKVELKQLASKVEFEVELGGVPAGRYALQVGATVRGSVQVAALASGGTYGETEFRNPIESGKLLLDFDPRGQAVTLTGASGVVASTTFPAQPNSAGGTPTGGFPTIAQVRADMNRVGPDSNASGELKFASQSSRQDFQIEVEQLDDGLYSVEVDGVIRASMTTVAGRAELEFRNPVEPGKLPLDFAVQGKTVRVLRSGLVYLTGVVPGG